ncbi:MAG TPA: hypothetical protein DIV79_12385 [Opitutae bacterium]|nr:hypothetical protein [Opitutaceae bacterium]HCR30804.1 hypothetical protein [Opitutae bacterium]
MQHFSKSILCHGLWALFAVVVGCSAAKGAEAWEVEALLLYNSGSPEVNDLRARSTGNVRLGRYAQA